MNVADLELIRRAAKLHRSWCERNGYIYEEPSSYYSTVTEAQYRQRDDKFVTLRSVRGFQAEYTYHAACNRLVRQNEHACERAAP